MAYIDCRLSSEVLHSRVDVALYLPADLPAPAGGAARGVLTLLHGYTNSGDDWLQMSAAARYAADNGLALVCPSCQNSFYQDMAHGPAWKTFVTEELPQRLQAMFRLPAQRENNWIAGLSMGGYGALYLGLSRPDLYAGCASFSGAVDLARMLAHADVPGVREIFAPVFGEELRLPETSDIMALARRTSALPAAAQPKILLTNGLEDTEVYEIRQQNDTVHAVLRTLPLAHYRRMQWPGVHEWNFWDRSLVYAIDYFLENGYAARKLSDWNTQPLVEETCAAPAQA